MTMGPHGHRYFEELAVSHVVGGLDESEGRVFRAHLLECGECRAQVGELRAIAHDLADIERDERRVRAAKAIDTKRREAEDDDLDDDELPGDSRASRIAVVVGLVLIIVLSAWNFTLRSQNVSLAERNRQSVEAGSVIEFGSRWDVIHEDGVQGTVKELNDRLAVLIVSAQPTHDYEIAIETNTGDTTHRVKESTSEDGRFLRAFHEPNAVSVTVRDPANDTDPSQTQNAPIVFEAKIPPPAPSPAS